MALRFGRKNAAGDAPANPVSSATDAAPVEAAPLEAAPVPAHAPASPPADALDAFDLDSFAALPLMETPLAETPAAPSPNVITGSAFDFPTTPITQITSPGISQIGAAGADPPDFDKLYEIEQANAARTGHPDVRPAAPAPFVPISAIIQEPAAPFYEPQVPVEEDKVPAPKKKFPLVPVLGALAILGAGGFVASMMRPAPEVDESAPVVTRPRVRPAPPVPNSAKAAAALEVVPVKPVPVKEGTASGGIVRAGVIRTGSASKSVTSGSNPVQPGIAPATDQLTQLKALWNQGANAKHRGDLAAARRYWMQGLKMQPGNVGFKQSMAKLRK